MKKLLIFLLEVAFVVNLLLLVSVIGECGSPRRAFYTITDGVMDRAYRFRNSWNIKTPVR